MALKGQHPERYKKIIGFYLKGEANSLDLLKADFAEWPIRDLQIINPPNFTVKFKSVFSTPQGLKFLIPQVKSHHLIPYLPTNVGFAVAGYYVLKGLAKAMTLGGFVYKNRGDNHIYMNDLLRVFHRLQSGRRRSSVTTSHELKHLVQMRDARDSLSSAIDNNRIDIGALMVFPANEDKARFLHYVAHEAEIQTRLHTILVGAYHQFQAPPLNKVELLIALETQGLAMPISIMDHLAEQPEYVKAKEKYQHDEALYLRYADRDAVRDINYLIDVLKPEHHDKFFLEMLPFVYGDTIELMGDRLGSKRMGHTHNIQLREVFYRAVDDLNKAKFEKNRQIETGEDLYLVESDISYYEDKALTAFASMVREDQVSLAVSIIKAEPYQEFADRSVMCDVTSCNVGEMVVRAAFAAAYDNENDLSLIKRAAKERRQEEQAAPQYTNQETLESRNPAEAGMAATL